MTVKTGLILAGGGARAAYQVGVLQAVAEILPREARQPFPIITGTSAGAINALGLAGRPGTFRYRTRALATMWTSLSSESIYRTDTLGVLRNAAEIVWGMIRAGRGRHRSLALLNNSPLKELLDDVVQFTHIERAIAHGELEAIGVTAMNYRNGNSTTFFQGQAHIQPWQRARRHSEACVLGTEHLLASSALPTLFPATRIGDDYFGDGALRQTRPLSSAIKLGADRLFIIGVSEQNREPNADEEDHIPPSIPQVLGQMLNAVFLDSVDTDLESLRRINALVEQLNARRLDAAGLADMRIIDTLIISPSESLSAIAKQYLHELPSSMRWFLKRTGSIKETGSGGALSYILFEQGYCQHLIELGYRDAMARCEDIRTFFDLNPEQGGRRMTPRIDGDGPVVKKPLNPVSKAWNKLIGKRTRRI